LCIIMGRQADKESQGCNKSMYCDEVSGVYLEETIFRYAQISSFLPTVLIASITALTISTSQSSSSTVTGVSFLTFSIRAFCKVEAKLKTKLAADVFTAASSYSRDCTISGVSNDFIGD
jgi:hypothetical protein